MNYQNYDDYMRNTLGFSGMNQSMGMPYGGCANMGCAGMCQNPYTNIANSMWQNQSCNLENLYPDSYRVYIQWLLHLVEMLQCQLQKIP